MELRQLRYFAAIARLRSFRKASDELRIAQAALSRQISLLERELGTPLLIRDRDGSRTTGAGDVLLAEADQILDLIDETKRRLSNNRGRIHGRVTVGLSPALAEDIASDLVEQVRASCAEVRLNFVEGLTSSLHQRLIDGSVDLAILSADSDPSGVHHITRMSEPICLIGCAKSDLLQDPSPIALSDAVQLPVIQIGIRREGIRGIVDRALTRAGLSFARPLAETETMAMARPLIESGQGYALSVQSAARWPIERGSLRARPIKRLQLSRVVACATTRPQTRATGEVAKAMKEMLARRFPPAPLPV